MKDELVKNLVHQLRKATLFIIVVGCISCSGDDDDDRSKYEFNETIRSTEARTPEGERDGFKLPEGFEIELFASEPQIGKPINLAFDARGRLWVTQSSSYPIPSEPGSAADKITILEDTDNDGRADKFTDFIDTLNVPIGVLPTEFGAMAFSIPNIYRFSDKNTDGKADDAMPVIGKFGYVDTHGMVSNFMRGYDGWIHACHGFTNKSTIAGSDGDSITLISGNTFRFTMDARHVEQTTFGQVNPFGLVFDALGYIYSTDSHSSPLYQLIRGGNYPHFGKEELMAFGPDMKSLENEATALCGITQYADVEFPEEFQGNFFIGDAVKSMVHRYSFVFKGSSPVGKSEEDFVLSEDPWFRPVNIKLGPDGALYVADFYNAIIGHYEVPLGHPKRDKTRGRIWRITYSGKQHQPVDLSVASIQELLKLLDHDNLSMRMEATNQITDRIGDSAVPSLREFLDQQETTPRQYIHALWALFRLGGMTPDIFQKSTVHDSALIRLHSLRIAREMDASHVDQAIVLRAINDPDPHVQRAAVELLTKYPTVNSLRSALALIGKVPDSDSHLVYTIKLTVRNLLREEPVIEGALASDWTDNEQRVMAEAMLEVNSTQAAVFLSRFLSKHEFAEKKARLAYRQMIGYLPGPMVEEAVRAAMNKDESDLSRTIPIFKAVQRGLDQRTEKISTAFMKSHAVRIGQGIFESLVPGDSAQSDEDLANMEFATELAGAYRITALKDKLVSLMRHPFEGVNGQRLRVTAFRSLVELSDDYVDLAAEVLLNDKEPVEFRAEIAEVLGEFPGSRANAVLEKIGNPPPVLQSAIVTSMAGTSGGKDIIFRLVRQGKIQARVLIEPHIEERILLNISKQQQNEYNDLTSNLQPISEEREKLIKERIREFRSFNQSAVSVDSGRIIFNRYCNACHRRANQIGIGPQLHGIGKRGPEAIIEKILDPNRNISKAFQNYTIRMKDGQVLVGLYRREQGAAIVFADMTGKEFTVAKADIQTKEASRYTLMPDNFRETISPQDFNALVAYLLTW